MQRLVRRKDCLSKLQVSAEREDGKMETLNLLNHLARSDISTSRLQLTQGTSGRFTLESRIAAMQQEFSLWLETSG